MNKRPNLTKSVAILICLLAFAFGVSAQKKKPAPKKPATAPVTNVELRAGAEKVSIQLLNVTKFIYILGGVATGIEDMDKLQKAGKLKPAEIDTNAKNKQAVVQSIRNLRAGLAKLETDFNASAALRNYTLFLGGISNDAAVAEEQAAGGQIRAAGNALIGVIEKLSNTLVQMP